MSIVITIEHAFTKLEGGTTAILHRGDELVGLAKGEAERLVGLGAAAETEVPTIEAEAKTAVSAAEKDAAATK